MLLKTYMETQNDNLHKTNESLTQKKTRGWLRYINTILMITIAVIQLFILLVLLKIHKPVWWQKDAPHKESLPVKVDDESYNSRIPKNSPSYNDDDIDLFFKSFFLDPEDLFVFSHRTPVSTGYRNFNRMHEEMNYIFNRAFNEFAWHNAVPGIDRGWNNLVLSPSMNIRDNGAEYEISVSLPGVDKGDISVTLEGSYLLISANRRSDTPGMKGIETYEQRIRLSGPLNTTQMKTLFENEILTITVPKGAETQPDDSAFLLKNRGIIARI